MVGMGGAIMGFVILYLTTRPLLDPVPVMCSGTILAIPRTPGVQPPHYKVVRDTFACLDAAAGSLQWVTQTTLIEDTTNVTEIEMLVARYLQGVRYWKTQCGHYQLEYALDECTYWNTVIWGALCVASLYLLLAWPFLFMHRVPGQGCRYRPGVCCYDRPGSCLLDTTVEDIHAWRKEDETGETDSETDAEHDSDAALLLSTAS